MCVCVFNFFYGWLVSLDDLTGLLIVAINLHILLVSVVRASLLNAGTYCSFACKTTTI